VRIFTNFVNIFQMSRLSSRLNTAEKLISADLKKIERLGFLRASFRPWGKNKSKQQVIWMGGLLKIVGLKNRDEKEKSSIVQ
jgi:hypothetical protein